MARVEGALARLGRADRAGKAFLRGAEVAAGERFGRDFHFAGLQPCIGQSYDPTPKVPRGGPDDDRGTGAGIDARKRVSRALDAVGPELAGILVDICGLELGLEEVERQRAWPVRSAKLVLKMALSALARHYGYDDTATGPETGRKGVRTWMAEGARPSIRPAQLPAAHRP